MKKIKSSEIINRLQSLKGWYLDKECIRKDWQFSNFNEAMHFINSVAELAERHQHHPEIYNIFSRVTMRFCTHKAKGITEKDFKIAKDIDSMKTEE